MCLINGLINYVIDRNIYKAINKLLMCFAFL